jgi:hypothetical protein
VFGNVAQRDGREAPVRSIVDDAVYVPVVVAGVAIGSGALVMLLITPWWLDAVERRGRLAVDKEQMRRNLQIRCIVPAIASLLIIAVGFLAKN